MDQVSTWPTPLANNAQGPGKVGPGGLNLQTVVDRWPTPMAGTPAQKGNNAAGNNDFSRRVMKLTENWPTPVASDDGRKVTLTAHQGGLIKAVHLFPSSLPVLSMDYGPPSFGGNRYYRQAFLRSTTLTPPWQAVLPSWATRITVKRLNPYFVEWLMGWPIGLTDCAKVVTGFAQWQQRSRGYLCQLISSEGPQ